MKRFSVLTCCLLLAGTLLCVPAFADDDATPPGAATVDLEGREVAEGVGEHHKNPMTDDQLQKMAAIRESLKEKTASQRSQLSALKFQLRNLMMADTIDRSAANALQSKINALKGDIATARLNAHIDMMGVLTSEQRTHLRHHMLMEQAFGCHHHHHHGEGGGGSCGGGERRHHGEGGGGWHHREGGGEHRHHEGGGGGGDHHESGGSAPTSSTSS